MPRKKETNLNQIKYIFKDKHIDNFLWYRCQRDSVPYFGVPGLGINAGLALMNLTRSYLCFHDDKYHLKMLS